MAIRRHVTAVRASSVDEVREVFTEILGEPFACVPIHDHGGWTWFMTSVWGVASSDLNKGLCRLARPALQFTTSDGCRWFLTVHGGPRGVESFLHDFGVMCGPADPARDEQAAEYASRFLVSDVDPELAFLEDEPNPEAAARSAHHRLSEEFQDCGTPLPESLIAEIRDLPHSAAANRVRQWHAESVIESLRGAGVPIESDEVRRALLWENVNENERGGDLGNLPRLLSVLGLGGDWDEYVRQSERPPEQIDEADACAAEGTGESAAEMPDESTDYLTRLCSQLADLARVPLEGLAVSLPIAKLPQLGVVSEACSTGSMPGVVVRMRFPSGIDRSEIRPADRAPEGVHVVLDDDGLVIALQNYHCFDKTMLQTFLGKRGTRLLSNPPDGTQVEVDFGVDGEPATHHRYAGMARYGKWHVESSYPRMTSSTVLSVLELAGRLWKNSVACRDEQEAETLERAARRDVNLWNNRLNRDGTTVSVEFDTGNLVKLLLRVRHGTEWDFGPVAAKAAQDFAEYRVQRRQYRRSAAEAARRRAAPHDEQVLWKGKHSWYWRSNFEQLEPLEQDARQKFDEALTKLGFTLIGDLVARKQRDVVVRVYVDADRRCYGVLMGKRTMYLGQEFVSRLSDGSGLTTTTNSMVGSDPSSGIFIRAFPGLEVEALYAKHVEGLERFRNRKGLEAVTLDDTLAGVAQEIEIAFARQVRSDALDALENEQDEEEEFDDEDLDVDDGVDEQPDEDEWGDEDDDLDETDDDP